MKKQNVLVLVATGDLVNPGIVENGDIERKYLVGDGESGVE